VGVGRRKLGRRRGRGNFEFRRGNWICDDLGSREGGLTWADPTQAVMISGPVP